MDENEKLQEKVIDRLDRIERRQEAALCLTLSIFAAGAGFTLLSYAGSNHNNLLALIIGIVAGVACLGIASCLLWGYRRVAKIP